MTLKKSDIYASVGTAIVCIVVLLILFLCGMSVSRNLIDDGLIVSFGEEMEGFGEAEEITEAVAQPEPAPAQPQPAPMTEDEPLMTQDDESVALTQEQKRKDEERERQRIAEEQRRKAEEQARLQAEQKKREEEARRAAEQQAKTDKANAMAGVFGQKIGTGSGTTTGESMQGNPVGNGMSGGHGWSLSGRSLKDALPRPAYHGNEQGRIVVNIKVDKNGNVTEANIDPTKSTITDKTIRDASAAAARQAKFSSGEGVVAGTITYNFKLN